MNIITDFNKFLNEDVITDKMRDTTSAYNKYKSRVKSFIKEDDMEKSREDFEKFLANLPENEKSASDMLRSAYSVEQMILQIDKLQQNKKEIEQQILDRTKELNDLKNKIK